MNWLKARFGEPESRAAAATALTAIAAELTGKIDLHTMTLTLAGCAIAFVAPGPAVPPVPPPAPAGK